MLFAGCEPLPNHPKQCVCVCVYTLPKLGNSLCDDGNDDDRQDKRDAFCQWGKCAREHARTKTTMLIFSKQSHTLTSARCVLWARMRRACTPTFRHQRAHACRRRSTHFGVRAYIGRTHTHARFLCSQTDRNHVCACVWVAVFRIPWAWWPWNRKYSKPHRNLCLRRFFFHPPLCADVVAEQAFCTLHVWVVIRRWHRRRATTAFTPTMITWPYYTCVMYFC